jgi:hypothetical protein
MGESRTELLSWLNELLSTRYTKVEQAGTGKRKNLFSTFHENLCNPL